MKKLTLLLVLSISGAYALEYDETVIQTRSRISVYNINCILPQGNIRKIYTKLDRPYVIHAQMEHKQATVVGCDSAAIDKLVQDSAMRFGHVDAKVNLIKRTSKESRIVFGKCQRNYDEEVIFEFDHDLVMKTDRIGKLIPASGC